MQLRLATGADTDALVTLINEAFQVEKFFKAEERTDAADLAEHMRAGHFLVLEDETGIAGCVYIQLHPQKDASPRGYFGMLSVAPSRQRAGVGRRLTDAAEQFCRDRGCRFMDISVVDLRTELPPVYEKLGYRITGTAPFPPHKKIKMPCSFILMSKDLAADR